MDNNYTKVMQTSTRESSDTRTPVVIRRIQTQPNLSTYPKMFAPSAPARVSTTDSVILGSESDFVDTCSEADSAISLSYGRGDELGQSTGSFASLATVQSDEYATVWSPPPSSSSSGNRFHILCREQVCRLREVMERRVCINAKQNTSSLQLPTIEFTLKEFLQRLRTRLQQRSIPIVNVRLNGGAATFVVFEADYTRTYNDVDLIFDVGEAEESMLEETKRVVFETLLDFLPEQTDDHSSTATLNDSKQTSESETTQKDEHSNDDDCDRSAFTCKPNAAAAPCRSYVNALKEAYVKKMIKVQNDGDSWSLISLSNDNGRNLEIKFVERIRRQYEFTVDSFHIILDSLLRFYESDKQMTEHYYPTIAAESVYGNYGQAFQHLQTRTIFTRNPEQIRGGGLLRYCRLLSEGYHCSSELDVQSTQQYMCSRFFIDFSSIGEQEAKLRGYLDSHFPGDDNKPAKHRYLLILYQVITESTICLMPHEMQQILLLVTCFAQQVAIEIQQAKVMQYVQYLRENLANHQLGMPACLMNRNGNLSPPATMCSGFFVKAASSGNEPKASDNANCADGAAQKGFATFTCTGDALTAHSQQTFNHFGGFRQQRSKFADGMFMYTPFKVHHAAATQPHSGGNYDCLTGCSNRTPVSSRKVLWRTSQSIVAVGAQAHCYTGGYHFQNTQALTGTAHSLRDATPCI